MEHDADRFNLDLALLAEQKAWLEKQAEAGSEEAEGILNLLDWIDDHADLIRAAVAERREPLGARFRLGRIVATPGALHAFEQAGEDAGAYVKRHVQGDWGEVPAEDKRSNEHALEHGERLMSAYTLGDGVKIWIITEWDRSVTTLLLPEEY